MPVPYSAHRPARNMGDAVRLFCLECMGAHDAFTDRQGDEVPAYRPFKSVAACPAVHSCGLWPYRSGKDPRRQAAAKKRAAHTNLG
jgi:hypothetical protein